jgi:hypothetical protein
MTHQFFGVHVRGVCHAELVILLLNEVPNFFRVDMMPAIVEEDPL